LKKRLLVIFVFFLYHQFWSQTLHLGGSAGVNNSYLLNKDISLGSSDTDYVLTAGYQYSAFASFFFDQGGYYSKRLYGIKTGFEYAYHNQTFDVFKPSLGPGIPREYYRYKLKLSFVDIPLLFNTSTSHHQGFYGEFGPVLSFQQGQSYQIIESNMSEVFKPDLSQYDFKKVTVNLVIGLGVMFNVTEKFAYFGSFRFGHSLMPNAIQLNGAINSASHYRAWGGIIFGAVYKINKYDAKKHRRARKFNGGVV
jgi:hypothetical protein